MICSMTGYGDASLATEGVTYAVEVRSLNNRYFKASIKLPDPLLYLEPDVERLLRERLGRGSVTFSLRMRSTNGIEAYEINVAALERYVRQLEPLAARGVAVTIELGSTLSLPGISQVAPAHRRAEGPAMGTPPGPDSAGSRQDYGDAPC